MNLQDEISIYTLSNLSYTKVFNNWWLYEMKYQSICTHGNLWYSRVLNNWWLYKMKYKSIHIEIYGTLECSIIDDYTRWNINLYT